MRPLRQGRTPLRSHARWRAAGGAVDADRAVGISRRQGAPLCSARAGARLTALTTRNGNLIRQVSTAPEVTTQASRRTGAQANRHKPSGIATVESILKWHLVPTLGPKRLDAITNEQVQRLRLALANRAPKTVNNVLTVLSTLLKRAVEWGELQRLPCTIKLLPNPRTTRGFHDFEQYERLLTVAR